MPASTDQDCTIKQRCLVTLGPDGAAADAAGVTVRERVSQGVPRRPPLRTGV